uniref:SH2 domain-containing protein n=1 Tax=Globodera rostochiensis TaxID=31243 RepID=A0A914HAZ7_GLORO
MFLLLLLYNERVQQQHYHVKSNFSRGQSMAILRRGEWAAQKNCGGKTMTRTASMSPVARAKPRAELTAAVNNARRAAQHDENSSDTEPKGSNNEKAIIDCESEEWYAGSIDRYLAEQMVVGDGKMPRGTFLVRMRQQAADSRFALTVNNSGEGQSDIKHYKIRDNGTDFFVSSRGTFPSIRNLIAYHSENPDGLCHRLTNPFPKHKFAGLHDND